MPREFELRKEVELDATPEQVWEAIATGPGISAWFMGPHEIEPGVGGQMSLTIGEFHETSTISAWEPGKRLAYQTPDGPDGTFHAMEYLIEARDGGSTVLRFVHSGFLSDDWGPEYEAMTGYGWDKYLHTLAKYLKHFTGRPATFVYATGPALPEGQDAWAKLLGALGLTEPLTNGDRVRMTPEGFDPIDGVVDYAVPGYRELLGVRGPDALYRFQGEGGRIVVAHHAFAGDDTAAWRDWLNRVFG